MRRVIFILAILSSLLVAAAQKRTGAPGLKEREITVLQVQPAILSKFWNSTSGQTRIDTLTKFGKTDMFVGGWVYSFRNNQEREAFLSKYVDFANKTLLTDDDKVDPSTYVDRGEIDAYGVATVRSYDNASFFVAGKDDIETLKDHQFDEGADGKGIGTSDQLTIFMGYQNEVLGEVEAKEKMKIVIHQGVFATEHYKEFNYLHHIDSIDARSEERIALFPICYDYEAGRIFKAVEPKILEGDVFHQSQVKRMGYDYKKYDPLAKYNIDNRYMTTGKSDTVRIKDRIGRKVKGHHYTVNMRVIRLGYDNKISEEEFEVDDGREILPLRFIEFKVDNKDINTDRYARTGQKQEGSDSKETNLFFKVGKAVLESDDYEGLKGLQEARQFAIDLANNENIYNMRFEIQGFASPEGNYASNADLAKRRAQYLMSQLQGIFRGDGGTYRVAEAKVQPWTVVADTLERRGDMEEAQAVRDICKATSDMNQQYQRIHALPYYDLIDKQILPALRIDRITAAYTIKRVLTPAEVLESYTSNKEPYIKGLGKDAYEYFHLFAHYKDDYAELEPLARTAYNKFKDDFKLDSTNRPWSLAAYHLARCLIHRKKYDAKLLEPYIKMGLPMNHPTAWNPKEIAPSKYAGSRFNGSNPYNDESIVLLQIQMLCSEGSYEKAKTLYQSVPGFQARYRTLGCFLDVFEKPQRILEPATRNAIAASSPWNKFVAYAACCGEETKHLVPNRMQLVKEAADMLRNKKDSAIFRNDDPRVHYINARLAFANLAEQNPQLTRYPQANTADKFAKFFNKKSLQQNSTVCNSLTKCFLLDESFLTEELRWDGYLPKGLYLAAEDYWKKIEDPSKLVFDKKSPDFYKRVQEKKAKESKISE